MISNDATSTNTAATHLDSKRSGGRWQPQPAYVDMVLRSKSWDALSSDTYDIIRVMPQCRNAAMCKICKLSPGDWSPNFRASNASADWQAALQQETMCATLFSTVSTCFSIFLVLLACVCLKLFSGNSRDQNATGEAWGFSPSHDPRNGVRIDIWPEHWGMTMRQIRKLMDECKETLIRHTGSQWSHAWFIFIPVAPSCAVFVAPCGTLWCFSAALPKPCCTGRSWLAPK